jgi:methyl-accepting chemotaxis protein
MLLQDTLLKMSIRNRLILNAVFIGIVFIAISAFVFSNSSKVKSLGRALQQVESLNSGMLTLRRNEKDFLARKDLKYLDKFQGNFNKLTTSINNLEQELLDLGLDTDTLLRFKNISNDYSSKFEQLVETQKLIGMHSKDGRYGTLRAAVHGVEEILKQHNKILLTADMLQLRRAEKDFMLRRDAKYLSKFDDGIAKFKSHLVQSDLDFSIKQKVESTLNQYRQDFNDLVEAERQIGLDHKSGLLGELRNTIHQTETLLKSLVETVNAEIMEAESTAETQSVVGFILAILVIGLGIYLISRSIIRPVESLVRTLDAIHDNKDLTIYADVIGNDEIATVSKKLNTLIDDYVRLIYNTMASVYTLDCVSEEVRDAALVTQDGMEHQFNESEMVATAGEEMHVTISQINDNTQSATAVANETGELASNGAREVKSTVSNIVSLADQLKGALDNIEKLEQDSDSISSVSTAIRGIAEQTNLLALNAAIEAARAGEQGRGFAVVADEVRTLAMRTQEQTAEIESIISSLQTSTKDIVVTMNQCYKSGVACSEDAQSAGDTLDQIADSVTRLVDQNNLIADAIEQQDIVSRTLSEHSIQIRDIAAESRERSNETVTAIKDMSHHAENLKVVIDEFKV